MAEFREVSDAAATGAVAAIYQEIREAYAAPYVSSLFRHLATWPGLLEWLWQALCPALHAGVLQEAAWSRVDVTGLPALPPMTRARLTELGVQGESVGAIRNICRTFARVSPVNLVVAGCMDRLLCGERPGDGSAAAFAEHDLPDVLPAMPAMAPWTDLDSRGCAVLATFETDLAGEVFVPGLYRILVRWPGFLEHLAIILAPMLRDRAILAICDDIADRITDAAPAVLARLPSPPPPPLAPSEIAMVRAAIRTYRGTSPQMVGFGTLVLAALPED